MCSEMCVGKKKEESEREEMNRDEMRQGQGDSLFALSTVADVAVQLFACLSSRSTDHYTQSNYCTV
jgi:hypothetical protein